MNFKSPQVTEIFSKDNFPFKIEHILKKPVMSAIKTYLDYYVHIAKTLTK